MKIAKIFALIGVILMTVALIQGFVIGDFSTDGNLIIQNPWGIVSLVDLYVGFMLFAMWIYFREEKVLHKVLWIVGLMVLGFFIGSLYVLLALIKSHDDWVLFFLGSKKEDLTT